MKKWIDQAKGLFCAWWKKLLICGIASLLFAIGLEGLQHLTQPRHYSPREVSAMNDVNLHTEDAFLQDGTKESSIIIAEENTVVRFDNLKESGSFNRVTLFYDPAEADGRVRIMYACESEELTSDERSYEQLFVAGQDRMDFTFEEGNYTQIELDMLSGRLRIKEIHTSWAEYEMVQDREKFSLRRVLILTVLLFAIGVFLYGIHGWTRFRSSMLRKKEGLCGNPKQTLINAGLFLVAALVCYIGVRLFLTYWWGKYNQVLNVFCIMTAGAAGCLVCFRKTLGQKPEIIFLAFCLLIGYQIAVFEPETTTVSWDDGFHYLNAQRYSYLGVERLTEQEYAALTPGAEREYDLTKLDEWRKTEDERHQNGVASLGYSGIPKKNFWSAFSGAGLFVARVIGLPFHQMWQTGRLFGLLAYAVIGYFAIRRLKSGKIILAGALLIPECVFLASNYSYDPGVTVLLALGLSYCFAEWQEPEKKLTLFNACVILISLFLGSWTKGVYFPVLLIPMCLPKDKFRSRAWRRGFLIAASLILLYLIYDVASPFLGSTATSYTDTRGSDSDAGLQIQCILADPVRYAGVLLQSLWTVIGPESANGLLTHFGYLGLMPNYYLYLIILAVITFTDKSAADTELSRRVWTRGFFQLLLFGIVCLIGTSMYVVYTPVGADGIAGFQCRYILPVLYPAMMLMGSGRIRNDMNPSLYNGIMFAAIGYVNFVAVLYGVMYTYY